MTVGDNGSLICQSIIPVDIIEWLNSNGEVIVSLTDARRLNLTFAPVNTSINNQMYICRVSKSASVNKTAIVSVTGRIIYIGNLILILLCYNLLLILTAEDPLMLEIHHPSISPFIGQEVIIGCTATTIVGVSQLPTLTLTHPNGTNLSRIVGKMASIKLDPVEVQDAGEYTCTGEIHLENITSAIVQAKQNITFKCKFIKTSLTIIILIILCY